MNASEAYSVMEYQCNTCKVSEHVYNMRDKVTPFTFKCPHCEEGTMYHINFAGDEKLPIDYIVPYGKLMFVDFTPKTALDAARKKVARFDGTEYELQGQAREDMIYNLAGTYMEDCCACRIVRNGDE